VETGHRGAGGATGIAAAEEALREREAFIRSIGDNLPGGMIYQLVRKPDGTRRFTYVSDGVRRLHGCSPEEALADAGRVYGTVLEEDRLRVAREEEEAHASFSVFRTQVRRTDPEGGLRWSSFASKPRRLPDGSTCWDGVELDVTEHRRAEEELRLREESYRTISRLMSEDVFRLDLSPDGNAEMTIVSEGLLGVTGPRADHARSPEDWSRIAHPEERDRLLGLLRTLAADGGCGEFEGRFAREDGTYRCVHLLAEAVPGDAGGRPAAILGAVADVTARRKAERDMKALQARLEAMNAELEEALRLKDEFLSSMSHELRTPLNAILGFLQALRDGVYGAPPERSLRAAGIAEDAGRHLLALISDILDLSKVQAGRLALELSAVPVGSLCESALHMVEKLAERKGIRLERELDPALATFVADGRRVKQILVNLLSNAVKFTPDGGHVRLAVSGDPAAGTVRIRVTDDGIGIPEAKLPRLFHPFTQVESGLSRLYPGTGLGLSLVLGLATLHGGGVEVRSRPGEGSCFTVTLPWRRSAGPAAPPEAAVEAEPAPAESCAGGGRGARVLVVEDNEASAALLSDYLSHRGFEVAVARNGLEALEAGRAVRPAVVLMDIQMPGMDGLETIRRFRAEQGDARTPILAVTALAMPGDRERCLAAGADGYLTKPLSLADLRRALERVLDARSTAGSSTMGSGVQSCIVRDNTRLHA